MCYLKTIIVNITIIVVLLGDKRVSLRYSRASTVAYIAVKMDALCNTMRLENKTKNRATTALQKSE